jgi:DNA-binding SARP family transcriptional activator
MFRLETLGCLNLRSENSVVAAGRRRLGLLAIVAAAGDRGIARDKLLLYLWSESSPENARHALDQLLYAMRHEISETLFRGTNPLRLNPTAITADISEFELALKRDSVDEAITLYHGPFLDGFVLHDAAEFERWLEVERDRLSRAYVAALTRAANSAAANGDQERAVSLWRHAVTLDPLAGNAVVGLMRALSSLGDNPVALAEARSYECTLRDELDIGPDRKFTEFVEELRSASTASTGASDVTSRAPPRAVTAVEVSSIGVTRSPAVEENPRRENPATVPPSGRWRSRAILAPLGLALFSLGMAVMWGARTLGRETTSALDDNRIVVLPLRFLARDSPAFATSVPMAELLASRLTGEGGPLAISPTRVVATSQKLFRQNAPSTIDDAVRLAKVSNAGKLLFASAVRTSRNQISLGGSMVSVRTGDQIARSDVEGSPDSLSLLADQLIGRLLAIVAGQPESRLGSLAPVPLSALRPFLEGSIAHRKGDTERAVSLFARALDADSGFALAAMEMSAALEWNFRWTVRMDSIFGRGVRLGSGVHVPGDDELWMRGVDVAWKKRRELNPSDLAYLVALRGDHYPVPSDARSVLGEWERAVRKIPERPEPWSRLGRVLLEQGRALGLADAWLRADAAFRKALQLDPYFMPAVAGLLEIAAFQRDTSRVRQLAAFYLANDSVGAVADYVRWRSATIQRDSAILTSQRLRFSQLDGQALEQIQWTSQVDGLALDDGALALAEMVRRAGERTQRWVALWTENMFALNSGRPHESLRLTEAKLQVEPDSTLFRRYRVVQALYWDSDSLAAVEAVTPLEKHALRAISAGLPEARTRDPYQDLFVVAQWRLSRGDTAGVARTIRLAKESFGRGYNPRGMTFALILQAILATNFHRSNARELVESLDSVAARGCCDTPHYADLIVAKLRERLGDRVGAYRAIKRCRWFYPPEYLSTCLREEGRLAALNGDRQNAISSYKQYLLLRCRGEPSNSVERMRIARELSRLARSQ